MHRRKKRQTSAKRHDDIVTPQLPRYNKLDSSSSENTSAEIRPISCVLGVSSDEADDVAERTIVSKEYNSWSLVCEIRIADKKRTENLSKIYLRRQSKFTKSERLCSINVVLSYWLERPGKLNFHQSFNAVDRETFRRDSTT